MDLDLACVAFQALKFTSQDAVLLPNTADKLVRDQQDADVGRVRQRNDVNAPSTRKVTDSTDEQKRLDLKHAMMLESNEPPRHDVIDVIKAQTVPFEKQRQTSNEHHGNTNKLGFCKVHDFSRQLSVSDDKEFECVATKAIAGLQICLYPTPKDIWVSGGIRKNGAWELDINRAIMSALKLYPNASFLDIGANIGMHSLVVAKSGRKVVAVEPKWATVLRLHKSVNLNNLQSSYTLIRNGISNSRENLTLYSDDKNQGGSSMVFASAHKETIQTVLFDDLLEVFHDQEAVIKMDIEGAESRALMNSTRFFSQVNVRVVFMEWTGTRHLLKKKIPVAFEIESIRHMLEQFTKFGFTPAKTRGRVSFADSFKLQNSLDLNDTLKWPNDIVWIKVP